MLSLFVFFLVSIAVYFLAKSDQRSQEKTGKGVISQQTDTLVSYFLSSGIKIVSYPMFMSLTIFTCFVITYVVQIRVGLWYLSIVVFFIVYRIIIQQIQRRSFKMQQKISLITPNIIQMLKTTYAVSSRDVGSVFRSTFEEVNMPVVREPMLTFVDGISSGGDPLALAKRTKIHFRNRLMRDLIDAIADEKAKGGLFSERLQQMYDEARRMNEIEAQTKVATLDSSYAAYFAAYLAIGIEVSLALWKPEIFEVFKSSPLGSLILLLIVLLAGFNLIIADSKSKLREV
ncbi:Flp pilus assembly protein TadB (plasmid) [Paenibacillus larvae subsp. larvae]|uniref:Flp pilus assembly protein TadB n=2 Tax=Paenibacillus larvae TaxID=1464 RepID=A0A2L1U7M8_9BACL|nr:hypothetical protein [Paenibacillus larvae]AQT86999.1 hypothetical protein B1222_23490 [Paenibacillus larvae subsp. pulvifaciens]AQZ49270.1 hypothetical protein B5S25_22450 [Paenibacillus larvae subsp. pulvifaciens]AVF28922.1 Flp pilus assembly protein TadB [Paenibacillus larvae subsp. larvae]AVF33304.1 Flp pilus assembly protein TadB [Paenibacillus larvae subsp. larvae]MBH0344821.1 hypothetical protein [Paenibacillus larvae]